MYLVGGSEGSLLFDTSYQTTGYEPGVNSINNFFFYSIDYYRKAIAKRLSSLLFVLFVYRYLQLHEQYREKLILPLFETRASRKKPPDDYPPIPSNKHPRYITMSTFKTALEKVEAFDIATGTETYPQTGGSASAIQAKQRYYRKRAATGLEVV